MPFIKVSLNHPHLKPYSKEIQNKAQQLVERATEIIRDAPANDVDPATGKVKNMDFRLPKGVWFDGHKIRDEIVVKEDSPLLPPKSDFEARGVLTKITLSFIVFGKGKPLHSDPDLTFDYYGALEGLTYRRSDPGFEGQGELNGPALFFLRASGKVISYLDLPGSILMITCLDRKIDMQGNASMTANCDENITIEKLLILTPLGVELEIKGSSLERHKEGNITFLIHRFNPDVDRFFDIYKSRD